MKIGVKINEPEQTQRYHREDKKKLKVDFSVRRGMDLRKQTWQD